MTFFLLPGAKFAQKLDVSTPLYQSLASERGEAAAAGCITACRAFGELRAALHEPPNTTITRTGIKRYLTALHFLLKQVKITSDIGAEFLWVNAFDANDSCKLSDIRIDIISALFNLAVCEATLADICYRQKRTDPTAIKKALHHFQIAAGYYRLAQDEPIPCGIRSVTSDLYPASLRALEHAMLGNAQQVLREIAVQNNYSFKIVARFAIGARDLYSIAEDACKDADVVNTAINAYVGRPAAALVSYLDVLAQSDQADGNRQDHDMPQQLTRLQIAKTSVRKGLTDVQSLETQSLASIEKLKTALLERLEELKSTLDSRYEETEDSNRSIYFCSPAKTVPNIVAKQLVAPADVKRVYTEEALDERLEAFRKLPGPVSPEMSGMASRYADMVAKTVADQVATIHTSASRLKESMTRLDAVIRTKREEAERESKASNAPQGSLEDDQKAIDAVKFAKDSGGVKSLAELQTQVQYLGGETKSQIQSIENLLQEEDIEDRQLRTRMHVLRQTSSVLTGEYWSKLTKVRTNLGQAATADNVVGSQIEAHKQAMSQLDSVNVHGFVPPSAMPQDTSSSQVSSRIDAIAKEVQIQIEAGSVQILANDIIVQELEKKKSLENHVKVISTISEGSAEVEQMTAVIDKEYGPLKLRVTEACDKMEGIEGFLSDAGRRLHHRPAQDGQKLEAQNLMNEVYRHKSAAEKFAELMRHLQHGANFYTREQDNLLMLKRDIEGFAAARKTEAKDLSDRAQNSVAQGGYPPTGLYPQTGGNPYPSGELGYPYSNDPNQPPSGPSGGYWGR